MLSPASFSGKCIHLRALFVHCGLQGAAPFESLAFSLEWRCSVRLISRPGYQTRIPVINGWFSRYARLSACSPLECGREGSGIRLAASQLDPRYDWIDCPPCSLIV
ncbi:hypothetical protein LZ31DRAFT_113744 [Colletotrichum somersetense]|nr:hypothetical protein LZ31DRAFT_113744 [Colletotrichum somersetense]